MEFRNVINDGTESAPRLRIQATAAWLTGLPRQGNPWTLAEKLDQITGAGLGGLESPCSSDAEAQELSDALRQRGLAFGLCASAASVDDLPAIIELAQRSQADYITLQVPGWLKSAPQSARILKDIYSLANDAGVCVLIETHCGQITQDLRRTVKIVRRFARIRFNGDFTHYVACPGVTGTWGQELWDHFQPIARRCSAWRGRVSFGSCRQEAIGEISAEPVQQFKRLWSIGMTAWMNKATPGDILPFSIDLRPPPEAAVGPDGQELSDRWEEGMLIKRLAEEAWTEARATTVAE